MSWVFEREVIKEAWDTHDKDDSDGTRRDLSGKSRSSCWRDGLSSVRTAAPTTPTLLGGRRQRSVVGWTAARAM